MLGFYCHYPYHHTAPNMAHEMPYALKGVDLVVHHVSRSLGLEVKVRPLLNQTELDDVDEYEYELDRDYYTDYPGEFPGLLPSQQCSCSDADCSGDCSPCFSGFPSFQEWKALKPKGDLIGTEFRELIFTETSEDALFRREEKEDVSSIILSLYSCLLLILFDRRSYGESGCVRNTGIYTG